MKTTLVLLSAALLGGCVYPRPGAQTVNSRFNATRTGATILGAAGGAYIGEKQGGTTGALIGAGAGALVTNLTVGAVGAMQNNAVEEAAEEARRQERLKIMNDYHTSHAVNGGNGPNGPESTQSRPQTAPVVYPAGVYDGVLYGPRVESTTAK